MRVFYLGLLMIYFLEDTVFFLELVFLVGLGPILQNLGSTFHDGLGVNLQICQDGFWSENDRKHPTKLFYYAFLLVDLFPSSTQTNANPIENRVL
jgi:hypothetical protein